MSKQILMLIIAIAMVALVGAQAFQISTFQKGFSAAQPSGDGGESYDEMTARMHPDQVKQTSTRYSQPSSTGMVGGC